jgi:hypothetical protein
LKLSVTCDLGAVLLFGAACPVHVPRSRFVDQCDAGFSWCRPLACMLNLLRDITFCVCEATFALFLAFLLARNAFNLKRYRGESIICFSVTRGDRLPYASDLFNFCSRPLLCLAETAMRYALPLRRLSRPLSTFIPEAQSLSNAARTQLDAPSAPNDHVQTLIDVTSLPNPMLAELSILPNSSFLIYPRFLSADDQRVLLKSALAKLGGKRRRRAPVRSPVGDYPLNDLFGADTDYDFEEASPLFDPDRSDTLLGPFRRCDSRLSRDDRLILAGIVPCRPRRYPPPALQTHRPSEHPCRPRNSYPAQYPDARPAPGVNGTHPAACRQCRSEREYDRWR